MPRSARRYARAACWRRQHVVSRNRLRLCYTERNRLRLCYTERNRLRLCYTDHNRLRLC